MTREEIARDLYTALMKRVAHVAGYDLHSWENQSEQLRDDWRAVADVVMAYPHDDRPH